MDITKISTEELKELLTKIRKELDKREKTKIIYACDKKGASEHNLKKYKNWAKVLTGIDTEKTNGFAFIGDFINLRTENLVFKDSLVVELTDNTNYKLYKAKEDNKKDLLLEGKQSELISFIRESKKIIEE